MLFLRNTRRLNVKRRAINVNRRGRQCNQGRRNKNNWVCFRGGSTWLCLSIPVTKLASTGVGRELGPRGRISFFPFPGSLSCFYDSGGGAPCRHGLAGAAVQCAISTPTSLRTTVRLPTSGDVDGQTLVLRSLTRNGVLPHGLDSYSSAVIVAHTLSKGPKRVSVLTTNATVHFLATCLDMAPNAQVVANARHVRRHPVHVLMSTLQRLNTHVRCIKGRKFPPLHVAKARLANDRVSLTNGIDSRCVSTLLVVNAILPGNLHLRLANSVVSHPCVGLALRLVHSFNTRTS